MITNLLKVGLLSALSMNAPILHNANNQTINTTADIYPEGNDNSQEYIDPTNEDLTWYYEETLDNAIKVESAYQYKSIIKQQKLIDGTADRVIFKYNNKPQMFTYLLIKLEPSITQMEYSYFTDFRVTMSGQYDQSTTYIIKGNLIASYDTTWEQYMNLTGMQDREVVYNEYKTMTYSSLAWEYPTDEFPVTDIDAERYINILNGRYNFISNPTIPIYICCAVWIEETDRSYTATYNAQWLDIDYIELTMQGSTGTTITQEVIDIPGLCFTVLTMPFTFVSTAFNITLFPGTQYQVNISLLFMAIFAILVFVFLIKKFTGK